MYKSHNDIIAGGFAKDGAVQDQIDATIDDAVNRARRQLPEGESLTHCEDCDIEIPEGRRKAITGVRLCINCQQQVDADNATFALFNRRGSKNSQLR